MGISETISGYGSVWLFTIFDLPVDSKKARKAYRLFRKTLIEQGFIQIQYSVYARFFATEERARHYRNVVKAALPAEGYVRMFTVTEAQYAKMESFVGRKRARLEKKPEQMQLF